MNPLPDPVLRGLPGPLPAGERALWQGSPDWRALALRALHLRLLAFYFVGLAVWQAGEAAIAGAPVGAIAGTLAWTGTLGALVLGLGALYAWWAARSTVYTITTARVVLTFGIALPVTLSVPYKSIGAAAVRVGAGGVGDIPLAVQEKRRLSYLVLWPHARPWRLARVEPMLRAVPDVAGVAEILSAALVEAQATRHASPDIRASEPRAIAAVPAEAGSLRSAAA